jgi:hypothetical protein
MKVKVRALANGNEMELDKDEAERFVAAGIFEYVTDKEEAKPTYKRRDLRAK